MLRRYILRSLETQSLSLLLLSPLKLAANCKYEISARAESVDVYLKGEEINVSSNDLKQHRRENVSAAKQNMSNQKPVQSEMYTNNVATAPSLRRVGNIFIITLEDYPFKHGWEVNKMLRDLHLEFRGQTVIMPDVPDIRKRLWRVRHLVKIDLLDLDEAKALVGIPEHITFTDLLGQMNNFFGRVKGFANPALRSKYNFMRYRRMRLRDVMLRDELEKQLLNEKRSKMNDTTNQEHLSVK